ncbi:hypothetical protein BGP_6464 [Beggiatoa sp. PS]|nr:hypothetical protein BGP_6464 [Beggiatoa sp. PS]
MSKLFLQSVFGFPYPFFWLNKNIKVQGLTEIFKIKKQAF